MAPNRLTDGFLRSVAPADKPRRFFDGAGLYIEVSPSGGKWWRLKYRFSGVEKRLSLGTYPDTSLDEARVRRDAARELLANGFDPREIAKDERTKMSQIRAAQGTATRFVLDSDGALSARFGTRRIVLTADETRDLRRFLDATRAVGCEVTTPCP